MKENNKSLQGSREKQYGIHFLMIGLLLAPGLGLSLLVASHSHRLITDWLENFCMALFGISIGLILVGAYYYGKNQKRETLHPKKLWFKVLYTFFIIIYVVGCTSVGVLLYGPNVTFKDWLVTTAMATMDHEYYCQWFYNDAEIEEVFSRNFLQEPEGSTDESLIDIRPPEAEQLKPEHQEQVAEIAYENKYEKQILDREEGAIYQIIRFKVNGCNAYLAVIYEPSRVKVVVTNRLGKQGQYLEKMAPASKALVAINGGRFYDPKHSSAGGQPKGITIQNGKVLTNNTYGKVTSGGIIGFTEEDKLVLLSKGTTAKQALDKKVRDALSCGPFLIVNGKSAYSKGNSGSGYSAKTAIGQRPDGIVLFLVVDSNSTRTKGATYADMTAIMENYGAINAASLDGGTSSVMVEKGKVINDPIDGDHKHQSRPIPTGFIVAK